ncbi:hypothetical protein LQE85_08855 [Stenotrophomonas rhizophila]|uniref:hypothetical protein n=1 Tax=Stenotrophomonas rhizophila TaxID=216778 RepID=UPI00201CEC05|nr:hypothetical protein [Stenotrophomonas rhizophila]UQY89291.1 hypothetical protein LQE85_08855 [Stenotrophomonas rhizophila]
MSNPELERIEALEVQVQAILGHLKAMEYGLRLLIATHPNPEVLIAASEGLEQRATSAHLDDDAMYSAAITQGITILRDQIEAAAALSDPAGDMPPLRTRSSGHN